MRVETKGKKETERDRDKKREREKENVVDELKTEETKHVRRIEEER